MSSSFPYSIPEKRALTQDEIDIISFLLKKEKIEWVDTIKNLKVIGRCGCGTCPTIMLGETFDSQPKEGQLIADYTGKDINNNLVGVLVFGNINILTEIEFYSTDGLSNTYGLPLIKTLKPVNTTSSKIDNFDFFIAKMPTSRVAEYILGCLDSSVYINFNNYNLKQVCIKRISFDGYGCCEPKTSLLSFNRLKPMNKKDSSVLKEMFRNNLINQDKLTEIIKRNLFENKHMLWLDALRKYNFI